MLQGDVPERDLAAFVLPELGRLQETGNQWAPYQLLDQERTVEAGLSPACSSAKDRLTEIRDNLLDRIAEAQREGWLGEVEGLEISLAGAEDKLTQLDAALKPSVIHLGLPTFGEIAARTS